MGATTKYIVDQWEMVTKCIDRFSSSMQERPLSTYYDLNSFSEPLSKYIHTSSAPS